MVLKKFCITFAWPWWCWKSPVANYLSINLDLPILNSDNIRSEVIEDLGYLDEDVFRSRLKERFLELVSNDKSFILDASVDRRWWEIKELLEKRKYTYYIISFDITRDFLETLYKNKGYHNFLPDIERYISDHKKFMEKYGQDVYITITDENYLSRLEIVTVAVNKMIKLKVMNKNIKFNSSSCLM